MFKKKWVAPGLWLNLESDMCFAMAGKTLAQDDFPGVYTVGYLTLINRNFPLSVSAIFNKAIYTQIGTENNFI